MYKAALLVGVLHFSLAACGASGVKICAHIVGDGFEIAIVNRGEGAVQVDGELIYRENIIFDFVPHEGVGRSRAKLIGDSFEGPDNRPFVTLQRGEMVTTRVDFELLRQYYHFDDGCYDVVAKYVHLSALGAAENGIRLESSPVTWCPAFGSTLPPP